MANPFEDYARLQMVREQIEWIYHTKCATCITHKCAGYITLKCATFHRL